MKVNIVNIPLIDLKAQYISLEKDINRAVLEVLSSSDYIMGKAVKQFEKEFASYLKVKNAISVANGTDALIIAMKALGIKEGDEVITTTFTFFSTAESISAIGAKPVFVDIDTATFNIDCSKLINKITDKTKAILPVHLFGLPANMKDILVIAKEQGLYVIEDACQAIGAEYHGKKVGTLGDVACFSFFPTKNLSCAGDGGMIVTNNDDIADIARAIRTHGSGVYGRRAYNLMNDIHEELEANNIENTVYNPTKYYNYIVGCNSRLDTIQAAILKVKLKKLDEWNDDRRKNATFYNSNIVNKLIEKPMDNIESKHVYHMYVIKSDYRDKLSYYLKEKGIATGVYYPIPLHLQKVYSGLGYKEGDLPKSEYVSKRTLAIPVYPELSMEQKQYIIDTINDFEV